MAASLLPIGILGLVLGGDAYSREVNEALDFNDALANSTMDVVDVALESAESLVEGAASSSQLDEALSGPAPNVTALTVELDQLRESSPLADLAFVIAPNGTLIAISPSSGLANTTGRDYSSRDYFQGAFACGCTYVSGSYRGSVITSPHGAVATTFSPGGKGPYLLGIALGTAEIDRRISSLELPHGAWVVLTDQYGIVLSHPDHALVDNLTDLSGEPWFALAQTTSTARLTAGASYNDTDAAISAVQSKLSGWMVAVVAPMANITAQANAVVYPIIIQTAMAAVVAGVIGLYLARRITRPVIELAQAAHVVELGGDMRMEADGSKEMDYLKESIASMASSLTQRLKENEALVAELEEAQQVREQLLDIISHELRTPVTVIQGYGELLTADGVGLPPERRQAAVEAMRRASQSLGYLIQSMVVFSRYRSGREVVRPERLRVGDLISEAAQHAGLEGARHAPSFQATVDPPDLEVEADHQKVLMVLHNLLENAAKFGPAGAPVRARAFAEDGHVIIAIRDEGPGFPKSVLDRVGRPFVTGDTSDSRMQGGLGLGLMVARAMVDLHGGSLTIDSRPGEGSTVYVRLPRDGQGS